MSINVFMFLKQTKYCYDEICRYIMGRVENILKVGTNKKKSDAEKGNISRIVYTKNSNRGKKSILNT